MRISKAVMITDQSQPPEAGARQVVYTHTHMHTRTNALAYTHILNIAAGECALAHSLHTQPGYETTKSPFTVLC